MRACFELRRNDIEQLVESGADISQVDLHGNTALHYVFLDQPNELKGWLCAMNVVRSGVDINAANHDGNTALHLSLSHITRNGFSGYAIQIDFMVAHGADLLVANNQGIRASDFILAFPSLFSEELVSSLRANSEQERLEAKVSMPTSKRNRPNGRL